MTLPSKVQINEEGPREGFQFEKHHIPTQRKIELVDSLSKTGLNQIQVASFVSPKAVPGMADAAEIVEGFTAAPGVTYARRSRFSSATRTGRWKRTSRGSMPRLPSTASRGCRWNAAG